MAKNKQAVVAAPCSEEEQMQILAQTIAEDKAKIKADTEALNEKQDRLIAYMKANNKNSFGGFTLSSRDSSVKLEGAKGKEMDAIKVRLINELDDIYINESLDLDAMWRAKDSDLALRDKLAHYKVQLVKGESSTSIRQEK